VKTWIFVEVLSVKAIPSCGGDLHRHSRVAAFGDIFYFGLRMYQFYFRCVCFVNSSNATSLHLRRGGSVKGIIVNSIIVIVYSRVSLMYSIYSPHWASIQSFIQSILFLTTITNLFKETEQAYRV
jgi:hypothetical protein